jgi:Flp pilus assembly protein TadG
LRRGLPRGLRDRSGVAAIEFAIVGPLFFLVLLGILIFAI